MDKPKPHQEHRKYCGLDHAMLLEFTMMCSSVNDFEGGQLGPTLTNPQPERGNSSYEVASFTIFTIKSLSSISPSCAPYDCCACFSPQEALCDVEIWWNLQCFHTSPVIQRCLHPASVSLELFWLPDVARLGCARQTDFDDHWPSNAFRIAIISQGSHSTNPKDMFFFIIFVVWLVSSRPVSFLSHPVVTGPLLPGCCLSYKKSWIIPLGFLWKTHPPLGTPWGPLGFPGPLGRLLIMSPLNFFFGHGDAEKTGDNLSRIAMGNAPGMLADFRLWNMGRFTMVPMICS